MCHVIATGNVSGILSRKQAERVISAIDFKSIDLILLQASYSPVLHITVMTPNCSALQRGLKLHAHLPR